MGRHNEVARVGRDGKWRLDDGTEVVPEDVTQYRVPLSARQGVFAHIFKCRDCKVEFVLLSWRRDRPIEVKVRCPECSGGVVPMTSVTLSESPAFGGGGIEVFQMGSLLERLAEAVRNAASESAGEA